MSNIEISKHLIKNFHLFICSEKLKSDIYHQDSRYDKYKSISNAYILGHYKQNHLNELHQMQQTGYP